jgi:AraC-like DNA-binding protein
MSTTRQSLAGPALIPLGDRERIDWHHHAEQQLIYPRRGVLRVTTTAGAWVVPPHRAVWVPAGVPHAHEAFGRTEMRTLVFPARVNPLRLRQPAVLAVSPLLREVIVRLSDEVDPPAATPRRNLEKVALDQLREVAALRLCLPTLTDDRLRAVAELIHAEPSDSRTLAELGRAVGASERTLSRLFHEQAGMSFQRWRTQARLHYSLALLATGASVTRAATTCGYSNASAFVAAFHATFGVTPGRYQRIAD